MLHILGFCCDTLHIWYWNSQLLLQWYCRKDTPKRNGLWQAFIFLTHGSAGWLKWLYFTQDIRIQFWLMYCILELGLKAKQLPSECPSCGNHRSTRAKPSCTSRFKVSCFDHSHFAKASHTTKSKVNIIGKYSYPKVERTEYLPNLL